MCVHISGLPWHDRHVQDSGRRGSRQPLQGAGKRALLAAIAASLIAILPLGVYGVADESGADQQQSGDVFLLPTLSEQEQVREALATTELAIGERLALFTSLATDCRDCAASLLDATAESALRLEVLGGSWQPWGEAGLTDWAGLEFELPTQPVPPPFTVAGTAAYMLATSRDQLSLLAGATTVTGERASDFGRVAAGRILSALALAAGFDFSAKSALADLSEQAFPQFELVSVGFPTSDVDSPGTDGTHGPGKEGEEREETQAGAASDELALVTLDCLSQSLVRGLRDVESEDPEFKEQLDFAASLQNRTVLLAASGVPDQREPRCQITEPADVSQARLSVLEVDLVLLASEREAVKAAAAQWTFDDAFKLGLKDPKTRQADIGLERESE